MSSDTWIEKNQKHLAASVDQIKLFLKQHIAKMKDEASAEDSMQKAPPEWDDENPTAIDKICSLFGLSEFERSLLLLCAGVELDAEVPRLCAEAQGNPDMTYPTFGLALAALPQAHWSAITPASPLRHYELIKLSEAVSIPITASPLRIDERILHYLIGTSYLDRRLSSIARPVHDRAPVVGSHQSIVERILCSWKDLKGDLPIVQLWGGDEDSKLAIAWKCCAENGLDMWRLDAELVPDKVDDVTSLSWLWTREAALSPSGLYISAWEVGPPRQAFVKLLIEQVRGPVFLGTRERWSLFGRPVISLEVITPKGA